MKIIGEYYRDENLDSGSFRPVPTMLADEEASGSMPDAAESCQDDESAVETCPAPELVFPETDTAEEKIQAGEKKIPSEKEGAEKNPSPCQAALAREEEDATSVDRSAGVDTYDEIPREKEAGSPKTATPASVVPTPEAPTIGIQETLDAIDRKLDAVLANQTDRIEKLYETNKMYADDIVFHSKKEFIEGIIHIADSVRKTLTRVDRNAPDKLYNHLSFVPEDIDDLLNNNGIKPYTDESEYFQPRTQTCLRTVITDDVALDNKIADRLKCGYYQIRKVKRRENDRDIYEDQVIYIRKEMVNVYKLLK